MYVCKQVMHNVIAPHPPSNTQPDPRKQTPCSRPTLPAFIVQHNATGHPFGQPGPDVLAVSPSRLLAGRAAPGAETSLTLCEHSSAATETLASYQHYSHPKSKPGIYQPLKRK